MVFSEYFQADNFSIPKGNAISDVWKVVGHNIMCVYVTVPPQRASMIWIIGEYAERIDNAAELLESFLEGFHDENTQVLQGKPT